jgi:RNA polymerase sigma-70 factor (ECF subfamily)
LRDILIKALEGLLPIFRPVFVLRDIEELSIEETAEVLGLSTSAVKARLWRARLQLRELLSHAFSDHKGVRAAVSPKQMHLDQPQSQQLSFT